MGWDGDYGTRCPNCSSTNTSMYSDSKLISYYFICADCGLHLYASEKVWKVTRSYIDTKMIGKNLQEIEDIAEIFVEDEERDEETIKGCLDY